MNLAFAHCSSAVDISGVTTWLEKLVLRLHGDGVKLSVHLHHFGENPNNASILPAFIDAGVPFEVVPRGRTLKTDVLQTLRFINRAQPTLFLPQCLNAHYFAASIAGKNGLPWALTIHSDDPDYWAIAAARPPFMYGGKMISVSEYIAHLASEQGLDANPSVIPCGVDVPHQTTRYNSDPFRVVYSGRLVESQKRMSLVVATLIHACMGNSNIYVSVVGDGSSFKDSKNAVENAGLAHRINFTGRLTPEQVKSELLNAQAILLMSDFEGLPVALLEAMAVGVVPVVRAIPSGIPELVKHENTGLLVDDNPENAAQALSRLANDVNLWQTCSTAARQLVSSRYSADACYKRWLSVIDELHSRSTVHYPLQVPNLLDLSLPEPLLYAGYSKPWTLYEKIASKIKMSLSSVCRL